MTFNLSFKTLAFVIAVAVTLMLIFGAASLCIKQSKALDIAREQNEALKASINSIHQQIQAHDARLERALVTYEQGVKHAKQEHEQRQEAIRDLEQTGDEKTKAWLCDVVPDDVCELFGLRADDRK